MTTTLRPPADLAVPTADDIAYTLTVAATIVEANGWNSGNLYDAAAVDAGTPREHAAVCAVGAINTAVAGTPVLGLSEDGNLTPQIILADMARAALGAHIGYKVPAWNDIPGRTAEQVVTALRETAASLQGRAA